MAEPLENFFDARLIASLAAELGSAHPGLDQEDLLVDHVVHFVKANGARRPEVFELRRLNLAALASAQLEARLAFVDLTTRKHYRGPHAIELLVNGVRFALCEFEVA